MLTITFDSILRNYKNNDNFAMIPSDLDKISCLICAKFLKYAMIIDTIYSRCKFI